MSSTNIHHGVAVLLGCDATSLVTGPSFSDVSPATQDTRTIFHFLHSATSSHFIACHKGTNNAVAQSNLPQKRIPQPHRWESLKIRIHVRNSLSVRYPVCLEKSKTNREINKKKQLFASYRKTQDSFNVDITLMAKMIYLDRVTWDVPYIARGRTWLYQFQSQ